MTPTTPEPERATRPVWFSEELALALCDTFEWGEPDADGFYTPTLHSDWDRERAHRAKGAATERERIAGLVEAVFDRDGHTDMCAHVRHPGNPFEPADPCTCGGDAVLAAIRDGDTRG